MRIGGYELLAELGRGGRGTVHRARAPDGRTVAVKLLAGVAGQDEIAAFEREKRLLATFGEAEGFVPILDSGTSPPFLVMPLLEGGTLRERFAKGPMKVEDAVSLVARLAKTLGRAHERGVVHRDLKPENVLFATHRGAESGSWAPPLVADLGLAKHFRRDVLGASQSRSLSATGFVGGTPGYMAPEQIDDSKSVGPATDVFALGAILHEALAGAKPYDGSNLITYGAAVAKGPPPPVRRLRPDAPRWLEEVVLRALARDPAARPADGHALARALLEGTKGSQRRKRLVALGALLGSGVGVVALTVALGAPKPPAPPPPPPPPARAAPRPANTSSQVSELAALADAAAVARRYEEAVELYTRLIALEPKVAEWHRYRALLRTNLDPVAAVADCDQGLAAVPGDAALHATRGALQHRLGRLREARLDLDRAIELDDSGDLGHDQRARLLERDNPLAALADVNRLLAINPDYPEAAGMKKRIEERLRTIEARSATDQGAANMGEAAASNGDLKTAIAHFTRAIEAGDSRCLVRRAQAFNGSQQFAKAEEDATRFLALDPRNPTALTIRGYARFGLNRHREAIADYDASLEVAPDDWFTYLGRAKARLTIKEVAGARADLDRSLQIREVAETYAVRSAIRRDAGDLEGSLEDAERAIKVDPGDPEGWIQSALIHSRLGQHDEAMAAWITLNMRHPKHPAVPAVRKALDEASARPR